MAKQIQLQIPTPCHEQWDNMETSQQGRFCNSCQKTVIDFTLMSDEQLAEFFNRQKSHVCGRFVSDQLQKNITIPVKKVHWLSYFFRISLPLFLCSLKSVAQQVILKENIVATPTQKKVSAVTGIVFPARILSGTVRDDRGMPVSFASVMVPGTKRGTATDSVGKFSMRLLPDEKFIEISSVGYESKLHTIKAKEDEINITLIRAIKGEVVVVGGAVVVHSRKKVKKKKETLPGICVPQNSLSIYPNPVSGYSKLTLEWRYPVDEEQLVEIYSIAGELLQKENIDPAKSNSMIIQLNLQHSGNYILRTTGNKTHKSLSTQFLVN